MARKKLGVRRGFQHNWKYVGHWGEKKIRPGLWRGRFRATKTTKAKTYGGVQRGSRLTWKIKGIQRAIKTGKGKYQTDFKFTKKLLRAKIRNSYQKTHR